MTVAALDESVLLRPADVTPLASDHRVVGVFNPAAVRLGDEVLLLVRVAEQPASTTPDQVAAPRVEWDRGEAAWTVDTYPAKGVDTRDPRVLRLPDGRVRLPHISHLRLVRLDARSADVKSIGSPDALQPQRPWEELGIEDPRITKIGDRYYITYVAISRSHGVATALMSTGDFVDFERHGIVFPAENKDVVLLPETQSGMYVAFHRPVPHTWVNTPSITISRSPDTLHWGDHSVLLEPRPGKWDSVKVGAGAPPVRLPQGWLLVYHGVDAATEANPIGRYSVGCALLALEDPSLVLARSGEPMLSPQRRHEVSGFVPNVLFPTGALLSEDGATLSILLGAADEVVTMQRMSVASILSHLGVE